MKTKRAYRLAFGSGAVFCTALLAGCATGTAMLEPAPTRVEPPPGDVLVKPGPDAANELDPSLFAGLPPQARAELGLPATPRAAQAAPPAAAAHAATGDKAAAGKVANARQPGKNSATARRDTNTAPVRIASVAVLGVKGAPGKGNAELARALRLVLRKAGWPVHAKARRDSMRITGQVELGPKTPRGQRVGLKWTVKAPNGRLLGVIRQNNIVPSGQLDRGFGPAALPVAEGAAEGIFQIVRRLHQG